MPIISLPLKKGDSKVIVNILWVFIPKTGGTSLLNFFKGLGADVLLGPEYNKIVGLIKCPAQHFDYRILEALVNFNAFNYRFTIVRHPIDKIKSDYIWSTRMFEAEARPSFNVWLENCMRKLKKNPYFLDNHLRPQIDFIGNNIDRVYKYEDGLEQIIKSIFSDLNISGADNLIIPKLNTSNTYLNSDRTSRDIVIDEADLRLIRSFYSQDFEKFGYD